MTYTGACFCGAIAYEIDGRLHGARSCHCSRCRRAFSAQASAYAEIEPGSLRWTRGEALLSSYVGKHGAGKRFCSRCGSMLCGVVGGEIHGVALGCLDEAPEGLTLTHIFTDSKASWEVLPQHIKAYPGPPTEPFE